ncbi:MAG TPA: acyl-CoA dehydrogenase family protein [Burkholderiales bacterium]|jgi:acyl-CoA dehydrogenase|nr:acyl-CoA dehydrogenase family protein [Burkholderiales bacterium]
MSAQSPWETEEVAMYRRTARQFIEKELVPHQERWRAQHRPDAEAWQGAGRAGLLLPDVPEDYGGGGGTFAHEAVVVEELAAAGVHFGSTIQSIVARYILVYGTEEQKRKWLPPMARGELVASIAMTEPGAGSDLQAIKTAARREGEHYVIKGAKTFISNAAHAGLVCLAAKTDPKSAGMRSLSLIMVETAGLAGYSVGRALDKVGMHGQDTCELFFDDARVPAANLIGPAEGRGFSQMMEQLPYERLSIAIGAVAVAERAVALTTKHAKERTAFGKPLFDLQNTRFKLAECASEARVGRVFVDHCIERFIAGRLDDASAAMAKYWATERQCRIVDECLQLHGGYGYMNEYPIARMWADSRVQRIYAGTNEVMKELIAWSL